MTHGDDGDKSNGGKAAHERASIDTKTPALLCWLATMHRVIKDNPTSFLDHGDTGESQLHTPENWHRSMQVLQFYNRSRSKALVKDAGTARRDMGT
jgi:DNA modification methylase